MDINENNYVSMVHRQPSAAAFLPAGINSRSSTDQYDYLPMFNALSLSDVPRPGGLNNLIVRNNPCTDHGCFSNTSNAHHQYPQDLSYCDIVHRMKVKSAARVTGLHNNQLHVNYHGLGNYNENNNFDPFSSLYNSDINGGGYSNYEGNISRSSDRNGSPYAIMGFPQSTINSNRYGSDQRRNGFNGWDNGSIYRRSATPSVSFSSLSDLRGKIYLAAKDQHGCRFLHGKFDEGNPEDIQMIFVELKDHICELMVDQFGNYTVQKLFEVCNVDQMTQLLCLLINEDHRFKNICTDIHGTRAVQKLLEHLTTGKQISLAISVLRRITVDLTKNMNGHHVIQHCLKFFSPEDNQHIMNVVADNCLNISTDKCGCCVLQQCVAHAQGEARQRLISEITSNALILAEHPYGNYVVQYILGLRQMHVTADITAQLSGSYVSLSMNKYGSNVVEKCLKELEGSEHVHHILEEIIRSPDFLRVLQDPYGNYVAQSAINISKGAIHNAITEFICGNYAFLHSHPHGKRVLQRIKGGKLRA